MTEFGEYAGVDSGGTLTRVLVRAAGRERAVSGLPSLNPASGGHLPDAWRELLSAVCSSGEARRRVWIASASVEPQAIDAELARLDLAAGAVGFSGEIVISNDVAPLLLAAPLGGVGVIAAVGTGTSFLARDRHGATAQASGNEYVLSDEGGAFDLAIHGLQAADRARDGRGPETALAAEAFEEYGLAIPELGRRLATSPRLKPEVARFAARVTAAATAGDVVAHGIVCRAAEAIATGVSAVIAGVDLTTRPEILMSGGVISGSRELESEVRSRLAARHPDAVVQLIRDATRPALEMARSPLPGWMRESAVAALATAVATYDRGRRAG